MLLVGPGGQNLKLVGRAGGGTGINGVTLTFNDAASSSLSGAISSGTYLPTVVSSTGTFSSPAPAAPYGTTLAPLAATPNGTWSLYVQDFAGGDTGSIANGWSLQFVTTTSTTNCCDTIPAPTLTSTTYSNGIVQFSWNATSGPSYQVQYRTNLTEGAWLNLGAPIAGSNTILGITDNVGDAPFRFYRLLIMP